MSRDDDDSTAWKDLHDRLEPGEIVEAIVFGNWAAWDSVPATEVGDDEPTPPIPLEKRGVVLTLAEAEPHMQSWQFRGGFGGADCYAAHIWTNRRVFWVHEYDGSTSLAAAPRSPSPVMPTLGS